MKPDIVKKVEQKWWNKYLPIAIIGTLTGGIIAIGLYAWCIIQIVKVFLPQPY